MASKYRNCGVPQGLEADTDVVVGVHVVQNVSEKTRHRGIVGAIRHRFDAMFSRKLLYTYEHRLGLNR